jgi:hypothetical protein
VSAIRGPPQLEHAINFLFHPFVPFVLFVFFVIQRDFRSSNGCRMNQGPARPLCPLRPLWFSPSVRQAIWPRFRRRGHQAVGLLLTGPAGSHAQRFGRLLSVARSDARSIT